MELVNIRNNTYKYRKIVSLFFIFTLATFLFCIVKNINRSDNLEVVYLDIGQGDSILIKDPDGLNFLIDTGSGHITTQKVQKELSIFNKNLDSALVTHPDSDHSGGVTSIINSIDTKKVIISTENDYSNYIKDKDSKVSLVNNSSNILLSNNISLKVLNPEPGMLGTENGKSIVNTMSYGNFNFIFTGDADSETERKLVSQGYFNKNEKKTSVNILKVGHHGSDTSSSEIFLKKIKPEYCIISVGKNNKYGHPAKNAMDRLEKYCKNIYRTDLNGRVSFKTDGKNLEISTKK